MVYCLWILAQDSKSNVNKYLLYKVGGSDRVEHNYSTEGLKVLFRIRLVSLLSQFNAIFHFQSSPSLFGDGKQLLKTTLKFSLFMSQSVNDVVSYAHQVWHYEVFSGYKYNFAWLKVQNPHSCGLSQKTAAAFLQSFHCSLLWASLASCGKVPASWSGSLLSLHPRGWAHCTVYSGLRTANSPS